MPLPKEHQYIPLICLFYCSLQAQVCVSILIKTEINISFCPVLISASNIFSLGGSIA